MSATRNGAILDHEGGWVAGCERGWGGVVGGADGKQTGKTGRTGRETAEGATEVREGTKDERKTKRSQDPGTSLAARHKRTPESTVRLFEPHPDAGSMRPKRAREWARASERPRCRISQPKLVVFRIECTSPRTQVAESSWLATVATPTREAVRKVVYHVSFSGSGIPFWLAHPSRRAGIFAASIPSKRGISKSTESRLPWLPDRA